MPEMFDQQMVRDNCYIRQRMVHEVLVFLEEFLEPQERTHTFLQTKLETDLNRGKRENIEDRHFLQVQTEKNAARQRLSL